MTHPRQILHSVFGFDDFRGEQETIITHAADGGDALVLMPTGGGKSLCYQIPALAREGTGIIISPLVALMHDQVAALRLAGVNARALNSSLTIDEQAEVTRAYAAGELDLLYLAPERLAVPHTVQLLKQARVALFAIDEAHCVSQWGHDFRPDYLRLSALADEWPDVPRIALTATATPETQRDIRVRLRLDDAKVFRASFDRPNIRYRIEPKTNARSQLLAFVRDEHRGESGIVYALSRKSVEDTAEFLRSNGVDAVAYHAGLAAEERAAAQERFLREDGVVVVATIAFGMGIDKPDVRFVAHVDLPKSVEGYYQETGRAGRDGDPADAWMVYGLGDVVQLRRFIEQSTGDVQVKRTQSRHLDSMLALCELTSCRRMFLLNYFGEDRAEACGNCDVCLDPPTIWDATVPAQKFLSTILRADRELRKRYGTGQHIDVLRGVSSDRTIRDGLEELTTWGIGTDLSVSAWRGVARHLIAAGMVMPTGEYGTLALTDLSKPVLAGDQHVHLREDVRRMVEKPASRRPAATRVAHALTSPQLERFERLRSWRREESRTQSVPAYVVFNDETLRDLAVTRPGTLAELASIHGIGDAKLERYGEAVLDVLTDEPAHGSVLIEGTPDSAPQ